MPLTDAHRWLLAHPLEYADADPAALTPYKTHRTMQDGAILTVVLAVDR